MHFRNINMIHASTCNAKLVDNCISGSGLWVCKISQILFSNLLPPPIVAWKWLKRVSRFSWVQWNKQCISYLEMPLRLAFGHKCTDVENQSQNSRFRYNVKFPTETMYSNNFECWEPSNKVQADHLQEIESSSDYMMMQFLHVPAKRLWSSLFTDWKSFI